MMIVVGGAGDDNGGRWSPIRNALEFGTLGIGRIPTGRMDERTMSTASRMLRNTQRKTHCRYSRLDE